MTPEQLRKELISLCDWSIGDYDEEQFLKLIILAKIEWGYEEYKKGWDECQKAIDNVFKFNL